MTQSLARAAVVMLSILVSSGAMAERSIQVYDVQHRRAEDLLPIALAGLGDRGNASVDTGTNALVLMGEPGAVSETIALLRMQDRRPRTVVLRHEVARTRDLERSGIRVAWNVGNDHYRIGNAVFPDGADRVVIRVDERQDAGTSNFSGTVRVLEGSSAHIATGETVPLETRSRYVRSTTLVTAESGFEATPRILGDGRIRVELVPTQAQVDAEGNVTFTRAVTTVIAKPGETVAVGGIRSATTTTRRGTGLGTNAGSESSVLLLTMDIESD
jgi:type II secretory pathway component GspD/PulD (secretin)